MKNKLKKSENRTTVGRKLSTCQKNLLSTILDQIQLFDTESNTYRTSVHEIIEKTGVTWNIDQLQEATCALGSQAFVIERTDRYTQFWMFQRVDCIDHSDEIEIMFSDYGLKLMKTLKFNLPETHFTRMILGE